MTSQRLNPSPSPIGSRSYFDGDSGPVVTAVDIGTLQRVWSVEADLWLRVAGAVDGGFIAEANVDADGVVLVGFLGR